MSIKKSISILAVVAIVGMIILVSLLGGKDEVVYTTAQVERGQIIQTVSETGTVKSESEIDLSFIATGRVNNIQVAIGDIVKKDDLLMELDFGALLIKKQESEASLAVTQASLNRLLSGATNEEIAISKAAVRQAKSAHEAAERELEKTRLLKAEVIAQAQKRLKDLELSTSADVTTEEQAVQAAQTALDNTRSTKLKAITDAIASAHDSSEDKLVAAAIALDTIDRVLTDEDADDQISIKNPSYKIATEGDYQNALDMISDAEASLALAILNDDASSTMAALTKTELVLDKTFSSLTNCYSALENSVTSANFTLTELDTFKSNINSQQTVIALAISTIQEKENTLSDAILNEGTDIASKEEALASAQAAYEKALTDAINALSNARLNYDQAVTSAESKVISSKEAWQVKQAELNNIEAPANKHDLALERAKVRQAEAALAAINKQIEDSQIAAPVDGLITKVEYEVGEQVSVGKPAMAMLGQNNFEIEVLISEADIAKVSLRDSADVTLDAFGERTHFNGEVFFIEPAETVIQDVIYYKVKLSFDPGEEVVKSGMTANITITTALRENVLIVPSRAVVDKNGEGRYIRVLVNNQVQEREVVTGLRGDGGNLELLDGANESDVVITAIKEQ
jgi:HlyD family secretion protein